jgi:hypothetical protein
MLRNGMIIHDFPYFPHTMAHLLGLLLLAYLCNLMVAQSDTPDDNNYFVYPPKSNSSWAQNHTVYQDNVVFEVGSAQPLQWTLNLTQYALFLYQEGPGSKGFRLACTVLNASIGCNDKTSYHNYYWTVALENLDLLAGNVFFLLLADLDPTGGNYLWSHYFNITNPKSQVSSSIPTAPSATTHLPTTSQASSAIGQKSSSSTVVAGGVGGAVGGALLLLGGLVIFLIFRRKRKEQNLVQRYHPPHPSAHQENMHQANMTRGSNTNSYWSGVSMTPHVPQKSPVNELPGSHEREPVELPLHP